MDLWFCGVGLRIEYTQNGGGNIDGDNMINL
jgi:hypothetical protein